MSEVKKAKYAKVLDIRKITTKNGDKNVVQFAKGAKLFIDGNEVDLGQYGTLFIKQRPELEADLDFKLEKGWLTEERKEQQIGYMDDKKVTASVEAKYKA